MIFMTLTLLCIIGALICALRRKNTGLNRPPGSPIPSALFLLWGFLHPNIGKFLSWIGKAYGPVLYVGLGPFKAMLISGPDAVKEACRHPLLNGRVDCMYKEVIGHKGILWADETSQKRRFIFRNSKHFSLGGKAVQNIIQDQITLLFKHFASFGRKPLSVKHAFNIPTLNAVAYRLFGEQIAHDDPNLINLVEALGVYATTILNSALRMSEVPNPIMRACVFAPSLTWWVPDGISGRSFVRKAVKGGKEFYEPYLERHMKTRIRNQPRDLADALMDEVEETEDTRSVFHVSENPIGPILFDMLCAAIETSGTVLEWVVLYLSHFPEVQAKLQNEVDAIVGPGRLPELSDRPKMNYLQAFLQEIFRIAPVIPFAPHMAVEDTVFRGYTIEKGTTIFNNLYGIHMDPTIWENPRELKPERFLDAEGRFIKCEQIFVFSAGRRSCVGEVTARDQLFLYVSRMAQSFGLVPEKRLKSFDGVFGMGYHCPEFKTFFNPRIP